MSWKVSALSAVLSVSLFPQMILAQDTATEPAQEPEKTSAETAAAPAAKGKGLLGDLRIGPSVALGLPHPLTGGVDFVYGDIVSLSVTGGRFGVAVEETELEIRNWDATVRWYPFFGSFFMGAAYGSQGIVGKLKTDVDVTTGGVTLKVPTTLRLEVESKYLTPQLGWFARWDSGLTLGFDIGYQMPSGVSTDLQTSFDNVSAASQQAVLNSEDYKKNKEDVEKAAEAFGKEAIPYVTFFRIGWLF
ncbi:MAG TPA: hypothetical protein VE954_06215 [Oligoflexus sp.]|uniref:hypothetical protein n=1 Tax=Oligoflexus sp. TaxID=1971216 RepID=UPI002D267425|nr:hypothetical protein [Oligoflexus sp.]HYX32689.1 hypothetical protein [Oligoflexus sp.]